VATQGRSFWVLDDLTPLHQLAPKVAAKVVHLFEPRPSYRLRSAATKEPPLTAGQNPPAGATIYYYLKEAPAKDTPVTIDICDKGGKLIRTYSSKAKEKQEKIEPAAGLNRFTWDLRYPDAETFPGLVLWGSLQGPRASPGTYQVRLKVGKETQSHYFKVLPDPRSSATQEDFDAQFAFLVEVRDRLSAAHRGIKQIREVREQLNQLMKRLGDKSHGDVTAAAKGLVKKMTDIEETIHQTKTQSSQDPLNFPIRINNKLVALASAVAMGDNRPTEQALQVKKELIAQMDAELAKLHAVFESDLPRFNALLRDQDVPNIFLAPATDPGKKTGPTAPRTPAR
jgi:hypothetical protein